MENKSWKRRLMERLFNKKGFTLLEVVLAAAMVSVFFTMTAFIIPTWYKAYTKTIQLNDARQMADSVMGTVEQKIRFANKVEILEPDEGGNDSVQRLTGTNGSSRFTIPMKGSSNLIDGLVYDEAYFMNHDMELTFSLSDDKSYCTVAVTIFDGTGSEKETVLRKTRAVGLSGENN